MINNALIQIKETFLSILNKHVNVSEMIKATYNDFEKNLDRIYEEVSLHC